MWPSWPRPSCSNDVALAEACRQDVEEFCKDEPADQVLACLHKHRGQLAGPCRAEETRLDILQARGWAARWRAAAPTDWCP